MREWLKTASATFAGGAVAIGLVAIPTYVWLPREFDGIRADISENHAAIDDSAAILASVAEKIDDLVDRTLNNRAEADFTLEMLGYMAASWDDGGQVRDQILTAHIPRSTIVEWRATGKIDLYKGAVVNGREFIFLDLFDVPKIPPADIQALKTVAGEDKFSFTIWDVTVFPGQNFQWDRQ